MSIENPPIFNTSIFNDLAFDNFSDGLSLEEADNRYLKLTGGFLSGTLSLKNNLLITRTTNGEALSVTNGTVNVGLHLLTSSSHIGTTSNHNFNIQANNNNVLQIQTGGSISVLNGGVITSGTTPLNSTNPTSSSNFRLSIDSVSGNIDLRNSNATDITLLSLFANGKRQLTLINNNDFVNIVNHNGSTTGLQLGGTLITATAAELNYNDITIIGTGEASKALILDANRDISNIRNLTTTSRLMLSSASNATLLGTTTAQNYGLCLFTTANANSQAQATGISFLNASADAIPHASIFMERISTTSGDLILASRSTTYNISEVLRCRDTGNVLVNTIKSQTNQGVITATGSSNFLDGSYNVTLSTFSSDGSNNFQIQQQNGSDGFIGTKSNHAFALMSNNTRALTVTTTQRIGIGTASPSTLLHVNGSVSTTVITGTYAQGSNTSYSSNILTPVTFSNSLRTSSSIYCQGDVYVFSDKRIKKNIEYVNENYADAFYDNIKVCKFNYKNQEENHNKSLGLIAQDVIKSGYMELINMVENPEMDEDDENNFKGLVLNVAYEKITMVNFMMIKKLLNKINKLENIISNLDIVEE